MTRYVPCLLLFAAAQTIAPLPAQAQEINHTPGVNISDFDANSADLYVADNAVVSGHLCVGDPCTDEEVFGTGQTLKLRAAQTHIYFQDTSGASQPDNDWRLLVNDPSGTGGLDRFSIEDITAGRIPFTVKAGAPDDGFWLDDTGHVGFGTALPLTDLHVIADENTTLRLEQAGAGLITQQGYEMTVNASGFRLIDSTASRVPFTSTAGAPNNALVIAADGALGVGTATPGAPFELATTDSFNFFRISATGAAINESVDITFTGGPLGTGQLRYNIVDGDNQEMSLDANGNMVLDGTLTTAGPTCAAGCDRVLNADFALPSIDQYHTQIRTAGHLPAIGPTLPDRPVNISEKLGGVIHELENAHLYIEELHSRLSTEQARNDQQARLISQLAKRLSEVEAR